MSMTVTTILQAFALFLIYTILTVAVPELLFHKKYTTKTLPERLMTDLTVSNFYLMNLVFVLQLLHISSIYTLLLFTLLPIAAFVVIPRRKTLKKCFLRQLTVWNRVSCGTMGKKTFFTHQYHRIRHILYTVCKNVWHQIHLHKTEYLFLAGLLLYTIFIYGTNEVQQYGYTVSDLPVHNYWINEMSNNNIFAAGVYPFGFHCVIYYIHTVFGIDTYVILRLFSVVQTLYLHLVLYAFIRAVCRFSFAAYAAMFLYITVDLYHENCTIRFISALPQEYGMLFILPCIYFLFAFFKHTKENAPKSVIRADLLLAAESFSMTIAVHFYDTMIAGLFCAAIVIGFFIRFFRPRYFFRLIGALTLALLLGILPMAVAAVCGKPMQGSIGWGMNIITGKQQTSSSSSGTASQTQQIALPDSSKQEVTPESENLTQDIDEETLVTPSVSTVKKTSHILIHFYKTLSENIQINVFEQNGYLFSAIILGCCGLLFLSGIGMCIGKHYDYGFQQISTSVFIILLLILFNAKDLGLPQFMDQNRSRIYLVYMLTVLYAMVVDLPASLVLFLLHRPRTANGISLILTGLICSGAVLLFGVRDCVIMPRVSILETNGAVTCLQQIIKERKGTTWTIVSANDERQMLAGHGQHYETITFLRYLKYAAAGQRVIIPTKYIYFYIEKIPLDYTVSYAGSGQHISREGAKKMLPDSSGINPYKGESRFIVMSKMYYWAEQFQKLFPQDMTVYYEDDEFICYQLIQNESSPFSLSIDYHYNQ